MKKGRIRHSKASQPAIFDFYNYFSSVLHLMQLKNSPVFILMDPKHLLYTSYISFVSNIQIFIVMYSYIESCSDTQSNRSHDNAHCPESAIDMKVRISNSKL